MEKKTEEYYHDLYWGEQLKVIDNKLTNILEVVATKASSTFVASVDERLHKIEDNHVVCPIFTTAKDVEQLKKDRDTLMDATEDQRYYKKKPNQLKMMIIGFIVMFLIYLATFIPIVKTVKGILTQKINTENPQQTPNQKNQ